MNTTDYGISRTVENLAIGESRGQTATSDLCREAFSPIQAAYPVLASPVGPPAIVSVRTQEPAECAVSQVRPWVRYWARMVDMWLFSAMVGITVGIYAPSIMNAPSIVITVGILFAWVLQEAILLANCGTTPGKWLFKINVRDSSGRKLKFSDALNRSFSVFLKGLGAGIPLISLFALFSSRSKLKRDGVTAWDEEGGHVVTHEKIGAGRSIVIVMIILGCLFLNALV